MSLPFNVTKQEYSCKWCGKKFMRYPNHMRSPYCVRCQKFDWLHDRCKTKEAKSGSAVRK